jgi:hypothetical protein
MSSMTRDSLAKRYQAIGLKPVEYMPMIRLIELWVHESSEEWTVKRLKDLRQLFLHRAVDLPYDCETRISLDRRGIPKGPFSVLFTRYTRGIRAFSKAWNALCVFTSMEAAQVTPSQAKKFLAGVRRSEPTQGALSPAIDLIALALRSLPKVKSAPPPRGEDLLNFVPRAAKERPVLGERTSELAALLYEAEKLTRSLGSMSSFSDIVLGTLSSVMRVRDHRILSDGVYSGRPVIGHVSAVQEPGYKARFIASPYPAVQQMMRPLHKWLADLNRTLPGNWQFDQQAGKAWVRDHLGVHQWATSVDLSGATDHFPLKLQTFCLQALSADEQWVSAVETFSHAMWTTGDLAPLFSKVEGLPHPYSLGFLKWEVGQPLGLIFSFNLFTLAHWALCYGICLDEGYTDSMFALVGDDVTWFDRVLANRYMSLMSSMGCPVSLQKTLESPKMAEFLSCLITPTHIIPSYKWKGTSDDNFLDIARCLGPRSVSLFKGRQRRIIGLISDIPEPLGMGWNPKGVSRYERTLKVPEDLPHLKEFKPVSADHHLWSMWYSTARLKGYLEDLAIHESTTDQAVHQVLAKVFGPIGLSDALRGPLVRDFFSLSSMLEDEFKKFGYARPDAIKLVPSELSMRLGLTTETVEVQEQRLSSLVREFREAYRGYTLTPERQTTLDRYEALLKRMLPPIPEPVKRRHVHRKMRK